LRSFRFVVMGRTIYGAVMPELNSHSALRVRAVRAMKQNFAGGCACGAIRNECTDEPMMMFYCHCCDCQRATGGPYSPAIITAKFWRTTAGVPWHSHVLLSDAAGVAKEAAGVADEAAGVANGAAGLANEGECVGGGGRCIYGGGGASAGRDGDSANEAEALDGDAESPDGASDVSEGFPKVIEG
jgi:hypothetical protein